MQFSEHVRIRKEKFGTVIFDTLTEKIFITNESGGEILQLIAQEKGAAEILSWLRNSYEPYEDTMEKDVNDFIEQLKANKFIKSEAEII